eukprot:scaffold12986_cov68-Cyclotella_meneghiniana.AAC.1
MPTNLFHIRPEMQLLRWVSDGRRYSSGEQMPRKTHTISRDNNQKQHLRCELNMKERCYDCSLFDAIPTIHRRIDLASLGGK